MLTSDGSLSRNLVSIYVESDPARRREQELRDKARMVLTQAIANNLIPPAKELMCAHCPEPAVDYHHHLGYEKAHWTDVIPMCKTCHWKAEGEGRPRCQGITQAGNQCNQWAMVGLRHCTHHLDQGLTPLEKRLIKEARDSRFKIAQAGVKIDQLVGACSDSSILKSLTNELKAIKKLLEASAKYP